jgi:hypothetical protein
MACNEVTEDKLMTSGSGHMRTRFHRIRGIVALASALALWGAAPLAAQEFIIHVNGDSINGDVKGFARGKLEFEIPGSSATHIEFDDLSAIGSPDMWDIELDNQTRVFGSLEPGSTPGSVRILFPSGEALEVPLGSIVTLTSIDSTFWSRLDGFLEFGFSFAKANSVTNYTLAAQVSYRGEKWASSFKLDSRSNSQDDAETTRRHQASLDLIRMFARTWYAGAFTQIEHNQELDLDLRWLLGVIGGRDILQSNKIEWKWLVGVLRNQEEYVGREPTTSAEALLGTTFNFFTFGNWESDIASSLLVYPSLTESGRVRVDFDISYRQDLFDDFYLRLSFYDQFDSQPPPGASDNDFGTTIAIGWDW